MKTNKLVIEHEGGRIFITAQEGGLCADLGLSSPTTEDYALLLSAAPEMLEALKMAMRVWPEHMRGSAVEAAIAKAEGRS